MTGLFELAKTTDEEPVGEPSPCFFPRLWKNRGELCLGDSPVFESCGSAGKILLVLEIVIDLLCCEILTFVFVSAMTGRGAEAFVGD